MGTKSPTTSVKSREIIGVDAFSQRREVFDKHDTVFLPASPTTMVPDYRDADPIVTSNHGKTTSNFKRNTTGSSSFRETRAEERNYDFRPRKYSDNFTSELNQSDDVACRYSALERTRRLSKMRREFLKSNLHEPEDKPFTRAGTRASLPAGRTTALKYKFESPNLYKFPFAEPYATPPEVRRVIVDGSPRETDGIGGKENEDPELRPKHLSLPGNSPTKVDHQKLFEELVKRYSPQRKPVNWTLPPTKPRVVASVPKSTSSVADAIDKDATDTAEKVEENNKSGDDDVFEKKENNNANKVSEEKTEQPDNHVQNGPENVSIQAGTKDDEKDLNSSEESKISLSDLEEKNDRVTELSVIQRQISRESAHKKPIAIEQTDLSIPALINKISEEGDKLETNTKTAKKVKRKRSFLDKLLGRKKDK